MATSNPSTITLDSIITEYLTNQHALCKNPMVTCPQFNLFEYVFFKLIYLSVISGILFKRFLILFTI